MQVFSKLKPPEIISWNQYYSNNVDLTKYKVVELKEILKKHKLHVSGKKSILIDRILHHFNRLRNVIKLQSFMRQKVVQKIIYMKGIALTNRKLCVNDTDFFSLEPLENIEFNDFFSYTDDQDLTYGFDINSLLVLLQKPGKTKNPYNRNEIPHNIIMNITMISKLQKCIYPVKFTSITQHTTIREDIIEKMSKIRELPEDERTEKLFYEMDLLGNYTSSSWFSNLPRNSYLNLIRYVYEFWGSRGNIPLSTKRKICPYFNPFHEGLQNINFGIRENTENISYVRKACLTVMENIVYTGINDEYKQLGAMHVLRALTMVSGDARASLPWLYESIDI